MCSTLGRVCVRDMVEDDAGSAVCRGGGRRRASHGAGAGGLWLRRALGARSPSRCWSAMVRSFSGARPRARRSRRTRRTSSHLRTPADPGLVEDDDGQGGHFPPLMMMVFHEIRHKSDHDGHREWGERTVTMSRDDTFNREEAASKGSRVRELETGWWRGETPLHHRGKETAEA